jgi:hypothetical protein
MVDREILIEAAKAAPEPRAASVAIEFSEGKPLFELVGELLRTGEGKALSLQGADLTSEEGRMAALRIQGEARGMLAAADLILDKVIEARSNQEEKANA